MNKKEWDISRRKGPEGGKTSGPFLGSVRGGQIQKLRICKNYVKNKFGSDIFFAFFVEK
ncbi:MAG TPA: hypothetical protein IAA08_09810 [Candidatus Eubacterium avistercoris]|uniref:Uncharacterized protein n=1 Tax=Candidatus Eubacterium avistercoris TaxID=2838567 RepID=A0A9D2IH69_9FIRM|nr:hypothetical protein [Candidatus Eubacterium avistercoris]